MEKRAAVAISSSGVPVGTARCSAPAVRMAMVEVVVTLRGREVPMIAYKTKGTNAV
jgi:hypothetical protein